jgi:rubrerythrin
MSTPSELIRFLQEARARELHSAALYRLLAERERDDRRRALFLRLAAEEEKHARQFGERIEALGGAISSAQPVSPPLDRFLARALGTEAMLRRMEREEERAIRLLDRQAGVLEGDPVSRRLFEEVEREEETHARLLQAIVPDAPARRLEAMLRREKWHVSTGSWIGDAI